MFFGDLVQVLLDRCIGRTDSYAVQQADGRYVRVRAPLTVDLVRAHLIGRLTLGTYPVTEQGLCHFAVFDADDAHGFVHMVELQQMFASLGLPSYLEDSRRGAHLWLFLETGCDPVLLRQALLPYCPDGVEFFPKRSWATEEHPGSAVRVPLGVHRRTGVRYFFVKDVQGVRIPYGSCSVASSLSWLSGALRVSVARLVDLVECQKPQMVQSRVVVQGSGWVDIVGWCAAQDPFIVISRYVDLDRSGQGCCPFGWHHSDGKDRHPSFVVYTPNLPNIMCWWCQVWGQGGSVFDFLKLYYGLSARELWQRIRNGASF